MTEVAEVLTDEQQALDWVNRYRAQRGLPELIELPDSIREATNNEFRLYRNRETTVFADVSDPAIGRALFHAGTGLVRAYLRVPSDPESKRWDVGLPSYLWQWAG